MDTILPPFIEELKSLGSDAGIDFKVQGGVVRLRGALLAVIANTPAKQLLGEYMESVGGTKRKYRHSMTDFDELHTKFEEDDFLFRDKELHHYHLTKLEQNGRWGACPRTPLEACAFGARSRSFAASETSLFFIAKGLNLC